ELPNCKAVSRTAATPDPLSLMPGPSGTLSRWAPAITTSMADPVLVCAIPLRAWMVLVSAESSTVAGPTLARSSAPSGLVTPTTGILTSVDSPRVPPICSSTTLSATTTATAPCCAAAPAFWANGQVPRSTSTTAPLTPTLSKSAALQPGLASVPTATSGPVTPGAAGLYSSARASNFLPATVTDPGSAGNTWASNCMVCTSNPLPRNLPTT